MKLLIHIGTHKTATSSFQNLCVDQKKLLVSNGLNYPNYKNWRQHSRAAWIAQKNNFSELKLFLASIHEDSLNLNCELTLISGEDFENFLIDNHLAKEFTHTAKEVGFKEIEWIVVHRDPFVYMQSIYSEMCKHNSVLDYITMGKLILDCGYVSVSTPLYNYHFVFKINKFAEIFKNNVSKNLQVIPFRQFIEDFPGKVILSKYLSDHSKESLLAYTHTKENLNQRLRPEDVEFRYIANFLGVNADQNFYEANKELADILIKNRIKRNINVLNYLRQEFEKIKL